MNNFIEVCLDRSNVTGAMNSTLFVDRVYYCLKDDSIDLNYGTFISKVHSNGFIRVLKSLGIYKVIGKGSNKKILMHPKLELIYKTTVVNNHTIAINIIDLVSNPKHIQNFDIDSFDAYEELTEHKIKRSDSGFSTYIILNPDTRLFKIGRSKNIVKRINGIKLEFSPDIRLIFYLPKDIESTLHYEYRLHRIHGEWFRVTMDDVLDMKTKYNMIDPRI